MATFSQRVSVSANDGFEIPATTPNLDAAYIQVGDNGGGVVTICRFTAVGIAQGATINTATITFTGQDSYEGPHMHVNVGCEKVADSAVPTEDDGNVANRAANITTAKTSWDISTIAADTTYQVNIKDPVQEIVNQAAWASGNDVAVLIIDIDCPASEWQQMYSCDGSGAKAPILDIDYTNPSAGGQPMQIRTQGIPTARRDRPRGWN